MATRDERAAVVDSLRRAIDAVPRDGSPAGAAPDDVALPGRRATDSEPRQPAPSSQDGADGQGSQDGPDEALRSEASAAANRAYAILAQRDHSRQELRTKLLDRDHPEPVVDALLVKLEDARLLDDRRFAQSFVRSQREGRGASQSAIRRSLRQRGVADEDAAEALEQAGDDFPIALEVARKKARSTRSLAPEVRLRRILGVLGRRGFGGSVAHRAAREALEEHPGDGAG